MNAHLLARVPIFNHLPDTELELLARTLQTREVAPETIVFREGEPGEYLYVVIYGQLDIIKSLGTPDERLLASRGPGEFVGELGLVNPDGLRTATVRSRGTTSFWQMRQADFHDLISRHPQTAFEMVKVLSGRLTVAHDQTIQDLHEKNEQLQQAFDELKAAQEELVEKERLERELQVAFEIQMSILPQSLPRLAGFNFGAKISPARFVGGDFYDVFLIDENKVGVVIGDVADKGVPSAIFMAQTHALMYAEARRGRSPGEVLREVNRDLARMNATGLFVTIIYGVLDGESGRFEYARAGHELPLLRCLGNQAKLVEWSQGQPVGLFDQPVFDEQQIRLKPGATLLLYTDGITDCRNAKGEFFGVDRLCLSMAGPRAGDAQHACDEIWKSLHKHLGQSAQDDDVTLLAVQRDRI